jgi:ArsR family metal-binding transcriptional regulator
MEDLIKTYDIRIVEAGCAPGSGRYGLQVDVSDDISPVFPYLNALLQETQYDHQNGILIWREAGAAYALRPHEILINHNSNDTAELPILARRIVERINSAWRNREQITPSFAEKARPSVIDIFKLLPKTNCKSCGYPTCLVFAADLREGKTGPERCPVLFKPEYSETREKLISLMSGG